MESVWKRGKNPLVSFLYLSALAFFIGFKFRYSHYTTPDLYDSQSDAIHVRNSVQVILTQIV